MAMSKAVQRTRCEPLCPRAAEGEERVTWAERGAQEPRISAHWQ